MVFADLLSMWVYLRLGRVLFFHIMKHFIIYSANSYPLLYLVATTQGMYWSLRLREVRSEFGALGSKA